jgi:hypothetical protein
MGCGNHCPFFGVYKLHGFQEASMIYRVMLILGLLLIGVVSAGAQDAETRTVLSGRRWWIAQVSRRSNVCR